MKNLFSILFFLLVCSAFSQIEMVDSNTDIQARLKIEFTDDFPVIIASAENTSNVFYSLKYQLMFFLKRPDKKNPEIITTQKETLEDLFTLKPLQTVQLLSGPLTLNQNDDMIFLLLIYDEDDNLMDQERLVLSESLRQNIINDGLKLTGLVADETKTKFGKDFYDFFYFHYTYNDIESEKIVRIEEVVSYRRNTQIKVTIDDEEIFSFFSKPDTEFLEDMSKIALQRVYEYLLRIKKENAYITQY